MSPTRCWQSAAALVVVMGIGLFASGCTSSPVQTKDLPSKEYQQLMAIGEAYVQAIKKLKRGPRDLAEFKSFLLARPDGNELVAAISSGEYVVIWGLTLKNLEAQTMPDGKSAYPIMAYQARSENGERFVLMHGSQVQQMTDDEFNKAVFAKGHKPR
jgi:hypothetical protein